MLQFITFACETLLSDDNFTVFFSLTANVSFCRIFIVYFCSFFCFLHRKSLDNRWLTCTIVVCFEVILSKIGDNCDGDKPLPFTCKCFSTVKTSFTHFPFVILFHSLNSVENVRIFYYYLHGMNCHRIELLQCGFLLVEVSARIQWAETQITLCVLAVV